MDTDKNITTFVFQFLTAFMKDNLNEQLRKFYLEGVARAKEVPATVVSPGTDDIYEPAKLF